MKKLKVTAVSYLNTKPFLYGIFSDKLDELIDLQLDIPSVCAEKLTLGQADLGLVPVAVIPELSTPHIVSDYCIGSEGSVYTVCIFSDCPIEEITHLYLDYHSRTSVELAKILLKKHWKATPVLLNAEEGFEQRIGGTHAALVIGDRTLEMHVKHPFAYDLGKAWTDYTGLPFVFAAWVSNEPLEDEFLLRFNKALKNGLDLIPQLVYLLPSPKPGFDLKAYFTNYISYNLNTQKRKALSRFLSEMNTENQPSFVNGLTHL